MSILFVYHVSSPQLPNKVLTHFEDIAPTLAEQGIVLERLPATTPVAAGATHEQVIAAYRTQIDGLMTERGYQAVDLISLDSNHPQKAELQAGWLNEHRHDADEVRFFVAGRALVSLRIGDFVYAVLCEKNDLISIPAGTPQWVDMGDNPRLIAIRLFKDANGVQSVPTGESLSREFPGLDD